MQPLRRRPPNCLADYLELARRRWPWMVLPAFLIVVVGLAAVRQLPRLYRSQALILVEAQKVPTDLVKPTVNSDINDLLSSISQEILSRTSLSGIIDKYGLYQALRPRYSQEELVQRMRQDIEGPKLATFQPEQASDREGGAFTIAYLGRSPLQAQEVTQELANLFIQENLRVRQQQAQGTANFIDVELGKARRTLQAQSDKLEALKSQYLGSLPEQQASNLQQLAQEQTALQAAEGAVARNQEQRNYLQSLLTALATPAAVAAAPSPLAQQLQLAETRLATLEQIDKPDHPDVIQLEAQIAALKKQLAAQPPSAVAAGPSGLSRQQIRGELATLAADTQWQQRQQKTIEAKIHELERRVELEPSVEAKLGSVQRDFDMAKLNYDSLQERKNAADIAAAMEQQAEGEEFRLIDPANLPARAAKPDLVKLGLGIVVAALALGLGAGIGREYADGSLRSERDVAYYLGVPLLASLPMILTRADLARRKRRRLVGWVASLAVTALVVGAGVFFALHGGAGLGRF